MSRYFACCGYRHLYELDSYLMSCEERPKVKVFASWMGKIWIWMLLKENWLCKSQTNNRPITIGEAQKSKSELITAGGIDQDISLKLIWKILLFNNELIKIFRLFFAIPDKKWVSHQTGKVRRPIRIAKIDRHTSKSWKKIVKLFHCNYYCKDRHTSKSWTTIVMLFHCNCYSKDRHTSKS